MRGMRGQYSVSNAFLPRFEGSTFSSLISNTASHLNPSFPNTDAMLGSHVRKDRDGFKSLNKKKENHHQGGWLTEKECAFPGHFWRYSWGLTHNSYFTCWITFLCMCFMFCFLSLCLMFNCSVPKFCWRELRNGLNGSKCGYHRSKTWPELNIVKAAIWPSLNKYFVHLNRQKKNQL